VPTAGLSWPAPFSLTPASRATDAHAPRSAALLSGRPDCRTRRAAEAPRCATRQAAAGHGCCRQTDARESVEPRCNSDPCKQRAHNATRAQGGVGHTHSRQQERQYTACNQGGAPHHSRPQAVVAAACGAAARTRVRKAQRQHPPAPSCTIEWCAQHSNNRVAMPQPHKKATTTNHACTRDMTCMQHN
jgi:hypothetical protein